ncbi:MAG: 50S ribosomal protein L29 [Paludibacteraceae bacterium]|nr:50S ribosomal protein L29 [Paludibacteraceae bacterium]
MKAKEVKELTTAELHERLDAQKAELQQMKLQHSISPLDNPLQIREVRKTIARLATEIRQRELTNK